jgi:hypothetical protein
MFRLLHGSGGIVIACPCSDLYLSSKLLITDRENSKPRDLPAKDMLFQKQGSVKKEKYALLRLQMVKA